MGLFNKRPDLITNPYLKQDTCPICTSRGITESVENLSRDTFDYKCDQCNPNVIIGITERALTSDLLKHLSTNPKRFELKEDIKNWNEQFYPVSIRTLSYFLGYAYEENLHDNVYEKWMKGDLAGLPRLYTHIQPEELKKINSEQEKIFEAKVKSRTNELVSNFKARMERSMDQTQLRAGEIESITYLLKTDNLPHKGSSENEIMQLGSLKLSLNKVRCIREQYRYAVNGELDINQILSLNQRVNIGSARAREQCMIDAVAYKRYLDFISTKTDQVKKDEPDFTDKKRLDTLKKVDNILEMISQMQFELQTGQQVIYDEIEDLKNLPILKKKNWTEIVQGKLLKLLLDKIITLEVFHKIYKELTGTDIKLLGE